MAPEDMVTSAPSSPPRIRPRVGDRPSSASRRAASEGPRTPRMGPYPATLALPSPTAYALALSGTQVRGDSSAALSTTANAIALAPSSESASALVRIEDVPSLGQAATLLTTAAIVSATHENPLLVRPYGYVSELEAAEIRARDMQRLQEMRVLGRAGIEQL